MLSQRGLNYLHIALLIAVSGALHLALLHATAAPPPVFTDSIHQLSLAQNVLDHKGLSTSILHYPDHYLFARIPAPQTVWPPGMGLLTAAVAAMGMTPLHAFTLVTFIVAFALPLVAYFGVKATSKSLTAAFVAAVLLLSIPGSWAYTQRLMSEPTFAFFTLSSLVLLTTSVARDYHRGLIAAAGLLAGCAFLVRYAGLFYIGASGLVLLCVVLSNRNVRSLAALAIYAVTSGLPVVALFARNWFVQDQLSGGQFIDAGPLGWSRAVLYFYWACKGLVANWLGGWLPDWLLNLTTVGLLLALAAMFGAALYRFVREPQARQNPAIVAVLIAVIYTLVTSAVHIASAARFAGWFLTEPRYFLVLLPLIVVAATLYLVDVFARRDVTIPALTLGRRALAPAAIALLALNVLLRWDETIAADSGHGQRHANVARALQVPLDESGLSIGDFLRQHLGDDRAVLTAYPESLYLQIGRPAVGLIEKRMATVEWTRETITALICKLPIDYVLTSPPGMIEAPDADRDLLAATLTEQSVDYLRHLNNREDLQLFAVDRARLQANDPAITCSP